VSQTVNASTCFVFILAGTHFAQTALNVESGQAFEEALFKQMVYPNSLRRQNNSCQEEGIGFESAHGLAPAFVARGTLRPWSRWRARDLCRIDWPFAPTLWRCSTRA
jgi:hypothetical protein